MFGKRTPERIRYAGTVLERRDNELARMRRQSNLEGQRIDILSGLVGLMENTDYARLRKMASAVVEDMKSELVEIDLSTPEGQRQAMSLQAEVRTMNWFSRGTDHLKAELREHKNRKDLLQADIEEADKIETKQRQKEDKSRRKNA